MDWLSLRKAAGKSMSIMMYRKDDQSCLEAFVRAEMTKAKLNVNTKLVTPDGLKKRKIMFLICSVLIALYVALIFFHFPIYTYAIGFVILLIVILISFF